MKFSDLIGPIAKIGAGIASVVFPPAAALIPIINAVLPADQQLPENATGDQISEAYEGLTPDQQSSLREKEIDLEIKKVEVDSDNYIAMTKADGQTTRPKIAWAMCQVLCFEIMAFTVFCFVYPEQMKNTVLWTVFGVLTATPTTVLIRYFGVLVKEQANRLKVGPQPFLGKLISQFTK